MQNNYDLLQNLNAEVMYITQLERDPAMLPRITDFVHNEFPIVCDPDQISRKPYPIFNAYIIDKKGIIRTRIPGTKEARPSLEMILKELSKVEGVPVVKPRKYQDAKPKPPSSDTVVPAEDVLNVLWMWSHDNIAEGDTFKLAFLPTLAEGFHVYAPNEKRMSPLKVEWKLPEHIEVIQPLQYPKPKKKHDPILKVDVLQYEKDIPFPALVFKVKEGIELGTIQFQATIHYQACNNELCYPPSRKTITLPIRVVSKDKKRNQVAGWENW